MCPARILSIDLSDACWGTAFEQSQNTRGLTVKLLIDQRGSVASELSFGAIIVAILVVAALFVTAQAEGESFRVLFDQIRNNH